MGREMILCVDDEEMVVDALKMELMRGLSNDFIIETALSGEEALRIADESKKRGDVILLVVSDQRMPGMPGEVLLSELNKTHPEALKILLTGYTDVGAIRYAINQAGLYRYIQKPWDREDLLLTINQAIDKFRTQKQLEAKSLQIMQMNEELEKTVEMRTLQLSEAVKELESFSYTVSHDLKSPLRSIDYYSKFILEDYESELNDDVKSMLKNIRGVCSDMFELIEKLLQYAVTAKTDPENSLVDMGLLIPQTFQEIMTSVEERQVDLVIEETLPVVNGDVLLLKQALHNILSNAVKFTRYQKRAIIKVAVSKIHNRYRFTISDNGVGFNMAYSSKVFGIFQRMHSQSEFEGSGIGLATVKKIVEKHGGSVGITSEEGLGATVSFTLPACSEAGEGVRKQ